MDIYLGIMSGTSMDAIDIVAASFEDKFQIISHQSCPFPPGIRQRLLNLTPQSTIHEIAELDHIMGMLFSDCANDLIAHSDNEKHVVKAIGCHGQTIYHNPNGALTNSIQIGDPNIITAKTGYPVVADFRRKDMALGGQGAPLVPAFHANIFSSTDHNRVAVNIGGIANISLLPTIGLVKGYDTGPGNTLMDLWINKHLGKDYDKGGQWARTGNVIEPLLFDMLSAPYFKTKPPKSTGKELFNENWLLHYLDNTGYSTKDVQATLNMLTATTIANAIKNDMPNCNEVILCGGGAYNELLSANISRLLPQAKVDKSDGYGIDPKLIEAAAFAWFARQRVLLKPGSLASVTGARENTIIGAIYQ